MCQASDAGYVPFVQADATQSLPFSNSVFDLVICQNMIECVGDRVGFVKEILRVLRPNGRLFLGHYDIGGVMIASAYRDLTRRIVCAEGDRIEDNQKFCDGHMGRLLPGTVNACGFDKIETETQLLVDLAPDAGSLASVYLNVVRIYGPRNGIDEEDIERWLLDLQERAMKGEFYFAIPWTYVIAWK
jgi:SAM-dependent methyltransferase